MLFILYNHFFKKISNKYLKILDEITCKYLEKIAQKYLNPENMSLRKVLGHIQLKGTAAR